MKLHEAKKIVDAIIGWGMVHQGVIEEYPKFDLKKYSLSELIKANALVKSNNSRKRKLQEHYRNKNGRSKSISINMTIADRGIAAIYTLMHFDSSGQSVAQFGNKYLGVIDSSDLC